MPRDLIQHPDPLPIAHPDTVRDKPDLSRPSLEALAYILRHREEWKLGWRWDFARGTDQACSPECGTAGCAMGIAWQRWGTDPTYVAVDVRAGATDFLSIFCNGTSDRRIAPEVVASRIDDHLAGRPIRYLVEGDRGTAGR